MHVLVFDFFGNCLAHMYKLGSNMYYLLSALEVTTVGSVCMWSRRICKKVNFNFF